MPIEIVICDQIREVNIYLNRILENDSSMRVIGNAFSAIEAISFVVRLNPSILIISSTPQDMEITTMISRIMRKSPTPILFLHSSKDRNTLESMRKMDIGIIDYIAVERLDNKIIVNEISITTRLHILSKLKVAKFSTQIKQGIAPQRSLKTSRPRENNTELEIPVKRNVQNENLKFSGENRSSRIVIIGTSTGGPKLLSELLPKFPKNLPPVVIVQHMPIGFITAFANRLNKLVGVRVKVAESGETLAPGTIYFAPGGKHLQFHRIGRNIPQILLTDGDPVNFVKPAVDVTLNSACKVYGRGVISVILTGMGSDGKEGSKIVKDLGGTILALNEEDSDIYGMNRSVIEAGLADKILPKRDIVMGIIRAIEGKL